MIVINMNIYPKTFFWKKKRMIVNVFFTCVLLLFSSCGETPESLLESTWVVDTFYYQGEDIFEEKMIINMMTFEDNNIVGIPKMNNDLKSKKDHEGSWEYKKDQQQLVIQSRNEYLNDTFNLCFKRIPNGNIKMVIQSEDVYMEAGLLSFSVNDINPLPLDCSLDKTISKPNM